MAEITKREKLAKASLYEIGYEYLRKNFHKFSQANKIRVAISILQIFEKDDSKTQPVNFNVVVNIENEDQIAQEPGNRISGFIEV